MKCENCSYQFDPLKEGNSKKRKCGMYCFGDSYSIRSKKEYERNLLLEIIQSQNNNKRISKSISYFYLK